MKLQLVRSPDGPDGYVAVLRSTSRASRITGAAGRRRSARAFPAATWV